MKVLKHLQANEEQVHFLPPKILFSSERSIEEVFTGALLLMVGPFSFWTLSRIVIVMIMNVLTSMRRTSMRGKRSSLSNTNHVFIYVLGLSFVDLVVILHLPFLVVDLVKGIPLPFVDIEAILRTPVFRPMVVWNSDVQTILVW
ncbi:hypothetical protein TELCIR_15960 [Teladorsagia circumcincta]|uniref:Uncharacterized protein n=1 Tax=Teladorsagia circumcincta TaxID=45464 RepID=A0A2G9TX12_TELCI|nr:hypothetical protein TELCIR_15960 [Teladorsagia circumcincta]